MSIIHVTEENFDEVVLGGEKTVLVDFFATWCGPCQMLAPTIEEIADEHPEYTVVKIDVDDAPGLAVKYGIVSIPTLVVIKNGDAVNKAIGVHSKDEILALLA